MKLTVLFDSSTWISLFKGEKVDLSNYKGSRVITSTIILYEVYRKYLIENPAYAEALIDEIRAHSQVVDVTSDIALRAAKLRQKYEFSMADALILSTAIQESAKLVTRDSDFKNVTEVEVDLL